MNISNKITDYSTSQRQEIESKLREMVSTINELDEIIKKEMDKPTPPTEGNNVIYLDMTPFTEYKNLEKETVQLHEAVEIYDRWLEKWNYLLKVNIGQFSGRGKLLHFIIQLRAVCVSFGSKL